MEIVTNDLLNYNNLKIIQCNEYFNFSLDSVLLANFVKVKPTTRKIIDLGTGNAPILLILSTRVNENVSLTGVELQKEIYDLAVKSLDINNLTSRINLLNMDVNNLLDYYESDTFDIVVSNPPYFKYNESSKINENLVKSIARHEINLKIDDLLIVSRKILKNNGSLYLVHRTERFIEIISKLKKYNLEPKRIQFIYPKRDNLSNLFLIEAVKNGKSSLKIESPLIIHTKNGNYSSKIVRMFGGNDVTEKL